MFGIDLGAFIVIVVVAIIFLGPDKFPEALVQIVKFWRTLKSGVQDAKETLQKEVDISELKTSVQEYKNSAEEYVKEMSSKVDLYGAVDSGTQDVKQEIELIKDSIESKPVEQK